MGLSPTSECALPGAPKKKGMEDYSSSMPFAETDQIR
jgi:hypothetical protein